MRKIASGLVASTIAVALVTAAIELLKPHVPVLSLGVLYLFAVLPIAVAYGLPLAILVSVASMLAFNWFELPPVHSFTLADSANWFALAVYLATAIVVSELATRSRRRARTAEQREREAAFLARLSTDLLGGRSLQAELPAIASRAAAVLGVPSAEISLGGGERPPHDMAPYPLEVGDRTVGAIYAPSDPNAEAQRRFLPALAALLAVAVDHDRLEHDAFEAETLRRSDLVKTALLRAVSHDLRTPLTGIRTAVGALRNPTLELDDRDRAELLDTIDVDSERLNRLVADLLDLSRLEAGAAAPDLELWSLDDLVHDAVDSIGARDRVEVVGDAAPLVHVDAAQIERVLVNFIENALKYSGPDAKVLIRITATRKEAIVRIVDQGPGLPESELERVFEPFYRASDGRGGAGLGLAVARGFAEANGGRVWAESRPDQGATFALALPVVESPVELSA